MRSSHILRKTLPAWCAVSLLLVFFQGTSQSKYENIKIDEQEGIFTYPPCEPSIVVNPKDPQNIIGGAILDKVYISEDGGHTWNVDKLESRFGVFGDPALVANKKGDIYFLHLSDPSGLGWAHPSILDRIVCQRSKDKGDNWSKGASIGLNGEKDQDKEWAVCDPQSCAIYTSWTQFDKYDSKELSDSSVILFSKANRRANKFSTPVRLSQYAGNCTDDDLTVEGAVPAAGPNGEVYVSWARGDSIFFDRSFDQGDTWLDKDIVAGTIVGGWDQDIPGIGRCNGMPVTMVDLSDGPNRGDIYINYTDFSNGSTNADVWIIKSTDKGSTWSKPILVNDDDSGKHQFFTWLSIDPTTGHLYTVFYDRRNYDDLRTDVFIASSQDGGQSWVNERVSQSPFTPSEDTFFGDYNNISVHSGVIRPIWTRMVDGKLSIWTAIIDH